LHRNGSPRIYVIARFNAGDRVEAVRGMGRKIETAWLWLAAFLPLALAVFGVVAILLPPPTVERKLVWVAVFVALDFAAIISVRQVQFGRTRKPAAAKKEGERLSKSAAARDGYCYFKIISATDGVPATLELILLNEGKFPLQDMTFSIKMNSRANSTPEEVLAMANSSPICSRDYGTMPVGIAETGYSLPYQEGIYQIDISTRNGRVCEIIRIVERGGGELFPYIDVYQGDKASHVVKSQYWADYSSQGRISTYPSAEHSQYELIPKTC
jgi:hypothetical protein